MTALLRKHCFLLFLLLSFKYSVSAGTDTLTYGNIESGRYIRATILPTGLHYEMLANKKNSVILSAEFNHYFGSAFFNLRPHFYYSMQPLVNLEYRHYYNLNRRIRKQDNVAFRSLNFVGILFESVFYGWPYESPSNLHFFDHEVSYIGPVWGIQRSLGVKKRIYWGLEFGVGYQLLKNKKNKYNEEISDFQIIGDLFTLGFII